MPRIAPAVSAMLKVGPLDAPTPPRTGRRAKAQDAELLGRVPIFADLSKRHLRRIASVAGEARFRPGATIVQEGTAGEAFHVILDGNAKVVIRGRTIDRMGPGQFFGEIALLDGAPRTASVIAETPLVTIRIYRRGFMRLLETEPSMTVKILGEVARRVRQHSRTLVD